MSVLSNTVIKEYLEFGRVVIDPTPDLGDSPCDPCPVKLHIGDTIQVPKKELKLAFDLSQTGGKLAETFKIPESGYILKPGKFCLAQMRERISFPKLSDTLLNPAKALAGKIEGRSTFARTGLFGTVKSISR